MRAGTLCTLVLGLLIIAAVKGSNDIKLSVARKVPYDYPFGIHVEGTGLRETTLQFGIWDASEMEVGSALLDSALGKAAITVSGDVDEFVQISGLELTAGREYAIMLCQAKGVCDIASKMIITTSACSIDQLGELGTAAFEISSGEKSPDEMPDSEQEAIASQVEDLHKKCPEFFREAAVASTDGKDVKTGVVDSAFAQDAAEFRQCALAPTSKFPWLAMSRSRLTENEVQEAKTKSTEALMALRDRLYKRSEELQEARPRAALNVEGLDPPEVTSLRDALRRAKSVAVDAEREIYLQLSERDGGEAAMKFTWAVGTLIASFTCPPVAIGMGIASVAHSLSTNDETGATVSGAGVVIGIASEATVGVNLNDVHTALAGAGTALSALSIGKAAEDVARESGDESSDVIDYTPLPGEEEP